MKNKGFTLIELMIVVAILALLVGIALPNFSSFRDEALNSKTMANFSTMRTAITAYVQNKGFAPGSLDELVTGDSFNALTKVPSDERKSTGTSKIYGYYRGSGGTQWVLWSNGVAGAINDPKLGKDIIDDQHVSLECVEFNPAVGATASTVIICATSAKRAVFGGIGKEIRVIN